MLGKLAILIVVIVSHQVYTLHIYSLCHYPQIKQFKSKL